MVCSVSVSTETLPGGRNRTEGDRQMAAPQRLAYRVAEFAEAIGASRAKAYELIAEGAVPSFRLGGAKGAIRVPVAGAQEWIDRQLAARIAENQP
jgi:predicted DNA-binding transcriptional regulator AlpA